MKIGPGGFETNAAELEALKLGGGGLAVYFLLWIAYVGTPAWLLSLAVALKIPIPPWVAEVVYPVSCVAFLFLGFIFAARGHQGRTQRVTREAQNRNRLDNAVESAKNAFNFMVTTWTPGDPMPMEAMRAVRMKIDSALAIIRG